MSNLNLVENEKDNFSNDETYEVERVLSKRIKFGRTEYKIKWKGYCITNSTWEPIENLTNCWSIVQDYEDRKNKKSKKNAPNNFQKNVDNNINSLDDEIEIKDRIVKEALINQNNQKINKKNTLNLTNFCLQDFYDEKRSEIFHAKLGSPNCILSLKSGKYLKSKLYENRKLKLQKKFYKTFTVINKIGIEITIDSNEEGIESLDSGSHKEIYIKVKWKEYKNQPDVENYISTYYFKEFFPNMLIRYYENCIKFTN